MVSIWTYLKFLLKPKLLKFEFHRWRETWRENQTLVVCRSGTQMSLTFHWELKPQPFHLLVPDTQPTAWPKAVFHKRRGNERKPQCSNLPVSLAMPPVISACGSLFIFGVFSQNIDLFPWPRQAVHCLEAPLHGTRKHMESLRQKNRHWLQGASPAKTALKSVWTLQSLCLSSRDWPRSSPTRGKPRLVLKARCWCTGKSSTGNGRERKEKETS